jgi:hypothetical protein
MQHSPEEAPTGARLPWRKPRVECLESRPEVSAYAGTGEPWARPSR